jgi:hypothetical protein
VIIGVDESGDFRLGSRGLFVGVFIRPSERVELVERYRAWERRTRRSLGAANELKGHTLTDSAGRSLFRDVLAYESERRMRYLAFAVDVSDENLAAMEAQRRFLSEDYGNWLAQLRSDGDVKRGRTIEEFATWATRLSAVQLLKLVTLGTIIPRLIEQALPLAILNYYDDELEHLQILIDRGYVKTDDLPKWRELLRNAVINESMLHPLAFLDTWTEDHPFINRFVENWAGDGPILLKPAFRDAIDFHDSVATPEIRIADVLASYIYRATIDGEDLQTYDLIHGLSLEPDTPYRGFVWTTNRRPAAPNPYLSLRREQDRESS